MTEQGIPMGKQRDSNFELLRIIMMFTIVCHHYFVNSGILEAIDVNHLTMNALAAQFFGAGGKIAIDVFILISGYHMINSRFDLRKVIRLWALMLFYNVVIFATFFCFGRESISAKSLVRVFFPVSSGFGSGFVQTYLILYAISPFINAALKSASKLQYRCTLLVLLYAFSFLPTLMLRDTWNYLGWMTVVYALGAYIRLFPISFKTRTWMLMLFLCIALLLGSIAVGDVIAQKVPALDARRIYYHLVFDANKSTALLCAVLLFMVFRNLHLNHSALINAIASTTLGILFIHANSDAMRNFLWVDVFNNVKWFKHSSYFMLHAVLSCCLVFMICSIIEFLRITVIDKRLFPNR